MISLARLGENEYGNLCMTYWKVKVMRDEMDRFEDRTCAIRSQQKGKIDLFLICNRVSPIRSCGLLML